MKILIAHDPFNESKPGWFQLGRWPAHWIAAAGPLELEPRAWAFRRRFSLAVRTTVRLHVSADERYELFIDGARVGRGPERGDIEQWCFDTYDLDLAAGEHVAVVRVQWLGALAPVSQVSVRPALVVAAENLAAEVLNTGEAVWECKRLTGIAWSKPAARGYYACGAKVRIDGAAFAWGFERGEGGGWEPAVRIAQAVNASGYTEYPSGLWRLRAAQLPAMRDEPRSIGRAVHVEEVPPDATGDRPVLAAHHRSAEAPTWDALLQRDQALTIAANRRMRVVVDLGDYYCGFSEAVLSRGAGASVTVGWAEGLWENEKGWAKGNRDQLEGKLVGAIGDSFVADGKPGRRFEAPWWHAGRYLEIVVQTAGEPLTIDRLGIRETGYPHRFVAEFASSDPRLAAVVPLALRTLAMCSHETYMDCPYYEQLMYIGDTRLQALVTYVSSADDRLPRKALQTFDESRQLSGLTQSRYPTRDRQIIPPFSLWWIGMIHDYAYWRDDAAFVRARMPGVRTVLDAIGATLGADGLLSAPKGWNFQDWVPGWDAGVPIDGAAGVSGLLAWQYAWVLRQAADLEELCGEPDLARRDRALAQRVSAAASAAFWDEGRGLFADDCAKTRFSEHSQCLALLAGIDGPKRARISEGLLTQELDRTTIYFSHYLFEAYRLLGRTDRIIERMQLWFDHAANGLKTLIEMPEPTRSDCHAWGAHPVFHYHATLLGIRPASPGFATVRIEPQLGPLVRARGSMPHPQGLITVDVACENGQLTGTVELPGTVSGTWVAGGRSIALRPGRQDVGRSAGQAH